jgi:hypothetical protein
MGMVLPNDFNYGKLEDLCWLFLDRAHLQRELLDIGSNNVNYHNYPEGTKNFGVSIQTDTIIAIDEYDDSKEVDSQNNYIPRHDRLMPRQFVEWRIEHDEAVAQTLQLVNKGTITPNTLSDGMAAFNVQIYIPFYLVYNAMSWELPYTSAAAPRGPDHNAVGTKAPNPIQMVINPPPPPFQKLFAFRLANMQSLARRLNEAFIPRPWLETIADMRFTMTDPGRKGIDSLTVGKQTFPLKFANQIVIDFFPAPDSDLPEPTFDLTDDQARIIELTHQFEQYLKAHPDAPKDYDTAAVLTGHYDEYIDLKMKLEGV